MLEEIKIMYDSRKDTKMHIDKVQLYITVFIGCLSDRAARHDASKLESPEKEVFDEWTPKLKSTMYGSRRYKEMLKEIGPAVEHHYKLNRHHPEHFGDEGIAGMDLIDLIEMFCDWKAASLRHDSGSIKESVRINKDRFNIPPILIDIFENTIDNLNW